MAEDRFSNIENTESLCFLCLKEADQLCKKCEIPFCCQEHFNVHYDEKIDYCFPFRVMQRPQVGRYVVATRDIEPLELIIKDKPGILGPNQKTAPACLECLLPVNGEYLCPECSLPLCGSNCTNGPNHLPECQVFSQKLPTNFKFRINFEDKKWENNNSPSSEYSCITPLRALKLKNNNPEMWSRLLLLMDTDEDRVIDKEHREMLQVDVIDFLTKVCGLNYSENEILRVLGIIRTNSINIQEKDISGCIQKLGRIVYPTLSYLSHSCICNAKYKMFKSDRSIKVNAQRKIKKDEEITIHYLSFQHAHLRRKNAMRDNWRFDCNCVRCQDPTEMRSYLSALKCSGCENGYVLPIDSMDLVSQWKCSVCGQKMSVESVNETISHCFNILYNRKWTLEDAEKMLPQLLQKLHPNNNMIMSVKQFLGDRYGIDDLEEISKKIQCYKDFLDVMGKVDPGYPTWRGQILYEMNRAILAQATKHYETGTISKNDFLSSLKSISSQLEESIKCLSVEEEGSKEANQAKLAAKSLAEIKEIIFFSDFI